MCSVFIYREDEIANEPEELEEIVDSQLPNANESEAGLEEQVKEGAEKSTGVVAGGGGKKGKKRKNDVDW